jgi:hypothetical protein
MVSLCEYNDFNFLFWILVIKSSLSQEQKKQGVALLFYFLFFYFIIFLFVLCILSCLHRIQEHLLEVFHAFFNFESRRLVT